MTNPLPPTERVMRIITINSFKDYSEFDFGALSFFERLKMCLAVLVGRVAVIKGERKINNYD